MTHAMTHAMMQAPAAAAPLPALTAHPALATRWGALSLAGREVLRMRVAGVAVYRCGATPWAVRRMALHNARTIRLESP